MPKLPAVHVKILLALAGPNAANGLSIPELSDAVAISADAVALWLGDLERLEHVAVTPFPNMPEWVVARIRF